jgi:hypothetical protein
MEIMVGNSTNLTLNATYRDGHTENVASQARYTTNAPEVVQLQNGLVRGLKEGTADITATYSDPMGNELQTSFSVRSTFFPFGKEYINTSLFSQGTYTESTRTFKPGQWGQMGWEYPNGADMSAYKYLVIKLKATSSQSHLNIFTEGSIWSPCYSTADFSSKKQIVVNLKTAKYTSDGDKKGKALETDNIRIVAFWGNGNQDIKVKDIYLTNNSDYTPMDPNTGIESIETANTSVSVYSLSGQLLRKNADAKHATDGLPSGMYIVGGKKTIKR